MKQQRRIDLYLYDMTTSIDRIMEYTKGLDFQAFQKNFMVVDAVARNFEIIGEAARKIPSELQLKYPNIPWQKMYRLRNIVSHEYFRIDHETLWEIATQHLPQNAIELKKIIQLEFKQKITPP
jgi:uncharacterized protein with HEPN domain